MRYFYIFILTLILISCNEKKGYSDIVVNYGVVEKVKDEGECRDANAKGQLLGFIGVQGTFFVEKVILYRNYVYYITQHQSNHHCEYKRKYHDK